MEAVGYPSVDEEVPAFNAREDGWIDAARHGDRQDTLSDHAALARRAPRRVSGGDTVLLLFNKPFGVLCQFSDRERRATLADYIAVPGIYPAGRLDQDSEGLVLLTDDGRLQARITDPRHAVAKTYWAQVEGTPDERALETLRRGVLLRDGRTRPAEVRPLPQPPALWPRTPPIRVRARIPTTWLELRLREGRNRQVRRMTAAVGYPTLRLVRVAVGPFTLEGLAPGQWREADPGTLDRVADKGDRRRDLRRDLRSRR